MPFGPEFPAVSVFWSTSSCFSSIACEFRQQQPGAADWAKPPQAAEGDSVCSLCNYLLGMSDAAMILAVRKRAVPENIDVVMEKRKEITPELFLFSLEDGLGDLAWQFLGACAWGGSCVGKVGWPWAPKGYLLPQVV